MLQLPDEGLAFGSGQPQQHTQFHALHPALRGQTSVGSVNSVNNLLTDSIGLIHRLGNGGTVLWSPPTEEWAASFTDDDETHVVFAATPWEAAAKLVAVMTERGVQPVPTSGKSFTMNTISQSPTAAATLDRFPSSIGNGDVCFTCSDIHAVNPPLR